MLSAAGLATQLYEIVFYNTVTSGLLCILVLFLSRAALFRKTGKARQAPSLPETIPFVSNSLQYMTDLPGFCRRAAEALQQSNAGIVTFRLLGRPAYLVSGGKIPQALFRTNSGLTPDNFLVLFVKVLWDPSGEDLARFAADKSGRLKNPAPGWENVPARDRLWASWHHIGAEYLTRAQPTNDLTAMYFQLFSEKLSRLPLNEWAELRVFDLLTRDMTESAAISLAGRRILEMNPGYFDAMRDFEGAVLSIAFGPPKWLNPRPYKARERWMAMNKIFMDEALRTFDWDGPEAKAEWDNTFGAPFAKKLVRWALDAGLSAQTTAGIFGIQILNQNSNTVPAAAWAMMDILKMGPGMVNRVREEAETALLVDPQTGKRQFDVQKLTALPLLQAIYVETLRLHISFSITRQAIRDTIVDGYEVRKGAIVQAPSLIAHYDDIWDSDGHSSSEFWPDRHLKHVETTDKEGNTTTRSEFSMGNRNPYWFPYGGGVSMCPGRNFAKQEIIVTIAILTTMFDIEFAEWTMLDGSPSDREARNSDGFATMLPDRDLKVRVKRRW